MNTSRRMLLPGIVCLILGPAVALAGGCSIWKRWTNVRPPTRAAIQLSHLVGGTHERMLIHEGIWYQAFAGSVLVLDPMADRLIAAIPLGEPGSVGPVVDLAIRGDRLFAVVRDDAVFELAIDDPLRPQILGSVGAGDLEVRPRRLTVIDDELYVSGDGGVARWSDGWVFLPGQEDVSGVTSFGGDLLACSARRVYRLRDGTYLGAANELSALPESFGGDAAFIFMRHAGTNAAVGLMSSDVRELESPAPRVAVRGPVRCVRLFDQRIWVVTDHAIEVFGVAADQLVRRRQIDILGARDIARIDDNHLAVAGSFGRAVYREEDGDDGPGDTFESAYREPSHLTRAHKGGSIIAAGSAEGVWLYTIGARAEFSELSESSLPPAAPMLEASTVQIQARVSPDGRFATIVINGVERVYADPDLARIRSIAAIDGDIWIGHDRGLSVLAIRDQGAVVAAHRLRLPGAVQHLYPLVTGGGTAFVSEFGGFGVAELIRERIPPEELELMTPEEIGAARRW